MLVRPPMYGAFTVDIIAMRLPYNRQIRCVLPRLTAMLSGLALSTSLLAASAQDSAPLLPLIVPESVFASLGRVTGNLGQQRIMDRGSILRINLPEADQSLPPDTRVIFLKQGLRLKDGNRSLGVLAIPIGQGQTLTRVVENQEFADPVAPGIGWVRLETVRQEISRGDSVMTRTQMARWADTGCTETDTGIAKNPPGSDDSPVPQNVIALADSHVSAGILSTSLDLVVITGGCQAGLQAGQTLSLWRPAVKAHGRKLDQPVEARDNNSASVFEDNPDITSTLVPGHRIGNGVVAAVYPDAAIVRIRLATQPIQIGDQARPMHIRVKP